MIDSDMIYAFMQDNAVAEITKSQKNVSGDNVSCAQATDRCLDLFFILSEYIQKKRRRKAPFDFDIYIMLCRKGCASAAMGAVARDKRVVAKTVFEAKTSSWP